MQKHGRLSLSASMASEVAFEMLCTPHTKNVGFCHRHIMCILGYDRKWFIRFFSHC